MKKYIKLFEEHSEPKNDSDLIKDITKNLEDYEEAGIYTSIVGDGTRICVTGNENDWDSGSEFRKEMKWFAKGENDMIGEDIEMWLNENGLGIIYPGKFDGEDSVFFDLKLA